jgi:hypothetical protein
MRLQDAKRFYDHEDEQDLQCDRTDCDGSMVKWDGDKVCNECGYMYDTRPPAHVRDDDVLLAERRVVSFRNRSEGGVPPRQSESCEADSRYGSGYYGPDRIRFVGGFFGAWFDDSGSLQL